MATNTKTKPKPGQSVAMVKPSGLPAVPDFMKGDAGKGRENIKASDLEMPRIKLVQGTDSELMAVHDGLHVGDFFHTLAEVRLAGEEGIDIVPLHISKRIVLWRPRPPIDEGGMLAMSNDTVHWDSGGDKEFEVKVAKGSKKTVKWHTRGTVAESGLLEWGTYDPEDDDSQPAATLCHVIVCALPAFPEFSPAALLLQRSGIKPARKLLSKINIIGGRVPIFGQVYRMTSATDGSDGMEFKNFVFTANGFVTDQVEYEGYKALNETFTQLGVKVRDIENANDDAPGRGNDAKSDAPKDRSGKSKY